MSSCVLDASALLALLNKEDGSEIVLDSLPKSVISTVNLAEVVTRLTLLGMPEREVRQAISILGLETFPFDLEQAYRAGILAADTQLFGLSLGDRACLALALKLQADVLTADRVWKSLVIGVEVKLIR